MKILAICLALLLSLTGVNAAPGDRYECKVESIQRIDMDPTQKKEFDPKDSRFKFTVLVHAKEIEVLNKSMDKEVSKTIMPIIGASASGLHGALIIPDLGLLTIGISDENDPTKNTYSISRVMHGGSFAVVWLLACDKNS